MTIDLRSDTVTKPTEEMRRAMALAEVGDDVYGEDITINELEAKGAALMGKEAELFVASGTMGNLLAVLSACQRGDEIIMEDQMHMFWYEVAGIAALAGVQIRTLPGAGGAVSEEDLRSAIRSEDIHFPRTRMFCMENTHNRAGGTVISKDKMESLYKIAKAHGLWVHTDGARIFNAAVFLGVEPRELAACTDSITFCLSKGLAAPVGSLLTGPKDFILRARKYRKMLGGGMRQAGVLAAPGLIALETMRLRLAEDHRRARQLAQGLADLGAGVVMGTVQTNIIRFQVPMAAEEFVARLAERGVLANPTGPDSIRFVTHYQVSDEDVEAVLSVCRDIFREEAQGR
ncbi:MAG TPA: low-specificity L-threonine aldolase [Bacillota bacterium]|nr:low-specificity L-threonine aldolase [Bacillota bacterium]HQD19660.1 low-specificity L-threonine aldolase [Bacillota bacterium]